MNEHPFQDQEIKREIECDPELENTAEQADPASGMTARIPGAALYDWAQALVTAIVAIVLIFIFVGRIIGVVGGSMIPTLHEGDRVLLRSAFYEPKAGDVVVLTKESFSDKPIVKRVIATEGQMLDIDFSTGEVWVDGVLQDEPYIAELTLKEGDMTFPLTVDEGCIFVMGDNRNASTDSRWSLIGQVDTRCVLGKVLLRIFPIGDFGVIK